jgi:hypothetical protein
MIRFDSMPVIQRELGGERQSISAEYFVLRANTHLGQLLIRNQTSGFKGQQAGQLDQQLQEECGRAYRKWAECRVCYTCKGRLRGRLGRRI